jgi:hypothetical protein
MKLNAHSAFRVVLLVSAFVLAISLTVLFQSPVSAQVSRQTIPRIETIRGNQGNVPPSYRLVISRPQDIVFVSCPSNYAPKLGYLRNVEAIQCEPFQSN